MAALTLRVRQAWRAAIRPQNTGELAEEWVRRMIPLILAYRARSAALARVSYREQRAAAAPGAPPMPSVEPDDLPVEALEAALTATGVAEYLEALHERGATPEQALERSATTVAGAAAKHALDGGRSYIRRAIERDVVAVGWYRVVKAGCCAFCAVLASRGAVYKQDSFADSDPRFEGDGEEKVHDHCACTLAPLYSRSQEVDERNRDLQAFWYQAVKADAEDVAKGRAPYVGFTFSGKEALNSFRRKYEALSSDG